jgi:O-antigen/teichoic acid export membrane protein
VARLQVVLAAACAIALAGAGVLAGIREPALGPPLLALGAAAGPLLALYTVRRACYFAPRPAAAALGSSVYVCACLPVVAALAAWHNVSAARSLLILGAAAAAGSVAAFLALGLGRRELAGSPGLGATAEAAREHWAYGRWALGSAAANWAASSSYPILLGAAVGLESAATFRACETLLLPLAQICAGLTLLLLPWAAARAAESGPRALGRLAGRLSAIMATLTSSYVVLITLAAPWLARLLWGANSYAAGGWMIPAIGASIVLRSVSDIGIGLLPRASGRPDVNFWCVAAGAAAAALAGLPLAMRYGAGGAAAARLLAAVVELAAMATWLARFIRTVQPARLEPQAV